MIIKHNFRDNDKKPNDQLVRIAQMLEQNTINKTNNLHNQVDKITTMVFSLLITSFVLIVISIIELVLILT